MTAPTAAPLALAIGAPIEPCGKAVHERAPTPSAERAYSKDEYIVQRVRCVIRKGGKPSAVKVDWKPTVVSQREYTSRWRYALANSDTHYAAERVTKLYRPRMLTQRAFRRIEWRASWVKWEDCNAELRRAVA